MVDKIIFDKIEVDTMESTSGIFIGKNTARDWDSHGKTQNLVSGEYINVEDSTFILIDEDVIDTPIIDKDWIGFPQKQKEKETPFKHKNIKIEGNDCSNNKKTS